MGAACPIPSPRVFVGLGLVIRDMLKGGGQRAASEGIEAAKIAWPEIKLCE